MTGQVTRLHPAVFQNVTQAEFEQAVADLDAAIPEMQDRQVTAGLMRIVALIGDAHTTIRTDWHYQRQYPLQLFWFKDGFCVVGAPADHPEALGARVVQIGETTVEDAYQAVVPLISHENDVLLRQEGAMLLVSPKALYALDILPDTENGHYIVQDRNGKQFTLDLVPVDADSFDDASSILGLESKTLLARRNPDSWYWYEYLAESETICFQYDKCAEMGTQSFGDFAREMFAFIDQHQVERIIVDLRYNDGGISTIINPLIRGLQMRPALNRKGKIIVLIGRDTYSSGLTNAVQLTQDVQGILIGEPTSGSPTYCANVRLLAAPNNDLWSAYSTTCSADIEGYPWPSLMPDVLIEPSLDDLVNCRDAALEAALSYSHR